MRAETTTPETDTMLLHREGEEPEVVWLSLDGKSPVAHDVNGLSVTLTPEEVELARVALGTKKGQVQGLLLKARKGADAGFGVGDWERVLAAVGFRMERQKEGRELVGVKVTAPNGDVLNVEKEPGYRCIVFYGINLPGESRGVTLAEWAEKRGFNIRDLAAKVLGLETMGQERERRGYYERDWTNTGTCGVCERNIKMNDPERQELVHHGYERPGDGGIHGDCFGVGYKPHELSPECAKNYLAQALRPHLAIVQEGLAELERTKKGEPLITSLMVDPGNPRTGRPPKYVKPGDADWDYELDRAIREATRDVNAALFEVQRFEKKVAAWKLDELPEVKLARKFGPPRAK